MDSLKSKDEKLSLQGALLRDYQEEDSCKLRDEAEQKKAIEEAVKNSTAKLKETLDSQVADLQDKLTAERLCHKKTKIKLEQAEIAQRQAQTVEQQKIQQAKVSRERADALQKKVDELATRLQEEQSKNRGSTTTTQTGSLVTS